MRHMAVGLAEELLVNLFDNGVVMRLSVRQVLVCIVQDLCTYGSQINGVAHACGLDRLTAAVYTAAGTCHYLDKVRIVLAAFDSAQQLARVACAAGNGNSYGKIAELILRELDALCAADI